jgi:hypothetical protein
MDASQNDLFTIEWDKMKVSTESIKWMLGANGTSKNEILSKLELGNIVAHCPTVMHKIAACVGNKIAAHVGNHATNRFALYMNFFHVPCGFHMSQHGIQSL